MPSRMLRRGVVLALAIGIAGAGSHVLHGQDPFRFRTGIELINVTATVTDSTGRFVPGLKPSDFRVFEDDQPVDITHFSAERVPVSLGIVLDTSGSMSGAKIAAARAALNRFLFDLLGPEDEVFLYRFDNAPHLLEAWTTDRQRISEELRGIQPDGATALYDAVDEALPLLKTGRHRKKALLVISDGNDTNSTTGVNELRSLIRESEVLVYALGVDGTASRNNGGSVRPPQIPLPIPFPFPRGGRRPAFPQIGGTWTRAANSDRVNADALRQITDDTGGRTEIVRGFDGLDAATARIADELSKQYYLGYSSGIEKDGRWHAIRLEVRDRRLTVRARRGYVAS